MPYPVGQGVQGGLLGVAGAQGGQVGGGSLSAPFRALVSQIELPFHL